MFTLKPLTRRLESIGSRVKPYPFPNSPPLDIAAELAHRAFVVVLGFNTSSSIAMSEYCIDDSLGVPHSPPNTTLYLSNGAVKCHFNGRTYTQCQKLVLLYTCVVMENPWPIAIYIEGTSKMAFSTIIFRPCTIMYKP